MGTAGKSLVLSLLFHLAVAWGLSWGLSGSSVDQETVDTLAQLDLSSVDLSFSEQEAESAPPQTAAPAAPLVEAPPPPPPSVDPFEPPPMEHLPDDPLAAVQLAQRPDDFHTELTPPDVTPPEFPEPPRETPPETPPPFAPSAATAPSAPAPLQDKIDALPSTDMKKLQKLLKKFYPKSSRERGEQGDVILDLVINEEGMVVSSSIVREKSVNFVELRDAAVKAVRAVRFKPATAGDKPVPAKVRLTLDFRLKDR